MMTEQTSEETESFLSPVATWQSVGRNVSFQLILDQDINQFYLYPSFIRALTPVSGAEAEAAGASFRVGRVQVEGTDPALVASGALDVLLHTHTHECTYTHTL